MIWDFNDDLKQQNELEGLFFSTKPLILPVQVK